MYLRILLKNDKNNVSHAFTPISTVNASCDDSNIQIQYMWFLGHI